MAKKKKNIKNQTFDVYPYLDQYQYLMRNGGALPWYQTEGPIEETVEEEETVDKKLDFKEWVLQDPVNRKGANAQEQYQEYLKGTPSEENTEGEETDGTRGGDYTDESVDNKCICPEGWERAGEEYFSSGSCSPTKSTCGEQISENAEDNDGEGDGSPEGEGCEKSVYFECAKKGLKVDPATCTCIEKVEESSETDKQKAIQDYQNGKISKKEMEDVVNSHNLGQGTKKGTPDYELSPTSKWGLLADAIGSTGQAIKGFGRQSINPKTGKPYTKADFKQTTLDTSKIGNANDAQLYWDDANLQKFIESGDKDMKLSDVIGTQGMHTSRRFNEFQDHRDNLITEYNEKGHLDNTNVASRQTMDRVTGNVTYDDVEYEEEVTEDNPNFNPDEPESEENPKTVTKTVTKTRAFDSENDRTEFDKARDKTKDYSVTDILVNPDADVTSLVRTGPEADPNVIMDDGMSNLQIEDYDPENDYTDNKKVIKKSSEEIKREKREEDNNNNNDDGNDNPSGLIEESRVDNGDGTTTIKYTNGATKVIKTQEGNQERKNRLRKEREEASMGLEMFVYGGQKQLDKYQDKGEKVHDFLEYTPNFPRTSVVPYTGNFTANELQNAITRDSSRIENDLANSWMYRNVIGQDQNHQSNLGPAGKLQLNREWLHKLLMQDDQERADKLNFYRNGGALPFYQDEGEKDKDNKNKSDGPSDPPKDNNAEKKEVPVDETNENANNDANNPDANATPPPDGSPEGDGTTDEEEANMTEEEMNEMDETTVADSGVVDSSYGNIANRVKANTKTGIVDRAINTYGDVSGAVTKWADFGNAVLEGWANDAAQTKAETENTDAESQFMVQESSQGIHDVNSGDSFTNEKVDEIYSGNNMKAPLIMQMGGQGMAQPVVDNVNYAALAEFTGSNPYNVEIGYSPEVIAYQKQIMAKMAYGGHLPMAKDGWWDKAKNWYEETDFKTPINKGLDYAQTAMSAAGTVPIVGNVVDAVNTATSGARAGYSAYEGDTEGAMKHTENMAINAASMIPGAGIAVGAASVAKDAAEYAGVTDGRSMTTQVADAVTPDKKDGKSPSALIAKAEETTLPKTEKPAPSTIAKKKDEPKIDKVAKYGTEVEIDYELLQELIKAGADIEII